jgi:hypothetical protein
MVSYPGGKRENLEYNNIPHDQAILYLIASLI